jgi:hypothetical protein
MSERRNTFCLSTSGTPLPRRKVTYDFSSSVMNNNAPPLRPSNGDDGKGREKGGRVRGRSEKLIRRWEGVIIFNIILLLRFLALFYGIVYCTVQYSTILCHTLFHAML